MATADRTLMLKLIADVNQPTKAMKGLGSSLKRAGSAAKAWGKAFTGALVIGGIEKVVGSLDDALKDFKEGEDAARTLGQTWKNLGRDSDQLAGLLDKLGGKALDLGFDDAEVIRAFNTYLTETGSVKDSTRGITAAMNLARAKGITFAKAVKIVKGSLGELGPELKRNRDQAQRWARNHPLEVGLGKITDLWGDFVGNFSKGNINKAFAALGGIGEQIGTLLFGGEVAPGVKTEGLVGKFAKLGPKIIDALLKGLSTLGARIQEVWDTQIATVDWAKAIPDALGTFWNDTLQPFLQGLAEKGPIASAAVAALAVAIGALGIAALPISVPMVLAAAAIAGITAAAVVLIDTLPGIQKELQKVQTAVQPILDTISGAFDATLGHIGNAIKLLKGVVDALIDAWNRLQELIGGGTVPESDDWDKVIDDLKKRGPHSGGAFAKGGIVTRPTVGLLGEAGPEAVIPLDGRHGLGGITVNVYAGVGNPVEIGREVDRVLRAYRGRAGLAA